ncbi:MAG TPA: RNA polymerase sigma factor [Nannocystaceae bacterium]|nr:RNA polymerase sigma factor [Nannocystaceae bacterium]
MDDARRGPSARMDAYLQGDDHALADLYRLLAPRVRRVVRARIDDPDLVEDIVQLTFVKAHLGRHAFRSRTIGAASDEAVVAWYMAIARNTAIDGVRSEQRHHRGRVRELEETTESCVIDDGAHPDPEAVALDDEAREETRSRVRAAILALPASQRDVVVLHKLRGLPMQEVAEQLQVRPGAVRVRAHRAYLSLARTLAAA